MLANKDIAAGIKAEAAQAGALFNGHVIAGDMTEYGRFSSWVDCQQIYTANGYMAWLGLG